MIIDYCEQGSEEWLHARLGIPTASEFGKIMTPTGRSSSQAMPYQNLLVAEWLLGYPQDQESFGFMEYGKETEEQARDTYEFMTGNEPVPVGFVYKDEERVVGCSPDSLLANRRRGLEIKCPQPHVHISYMLAESCPLKYLPQVQGCMYVTGYDEWDFMSYHPDFPPLIVTVKRDREYIRQLSSFMEKFINGMFVKRKKLEEYRRV